jgi:hypothetical protein
MKKLGFPWALLFAALCAVAGCPVDPGRYAYVSCTVGGNPVMLADGDIPYLADEHPFAYGGISSAKSLVYVEASDENDNDHFLRFQVKGTTAGTYTGDDIQFEYAVNYAADEQYGNFDQVFTVTVSAVGEVNGFIEGTFSGTVRDDENNTLDLSEGSFRVVRVE